MCLNISLYTLVCASRINRPRACILVRKINIWMLLGFSCRDLVAVLINYNDSERKR
jgi:hypothetical protein